MSNETQFNLFENNEQKEELKKALNQTENKQNDLQTAFSKGTESSFSINGYQAEILKEENIIGSAEELYSSYLFCKQSQHNNNILVVTIEDEDINKQKLQQILIESKNYIEKETGNHISIISHLASEDLEPVGIEKAERYFNTLGNKLKSLNKNNDYEKEEMEKLKNQNEEVDEEDLTLEEDVSPEKETKKNKQNKYR